MLERLEAERDRTATAVLKAQEGERARLARDLHDEANQALTGVLLRLEATAQDAPPALRAELRETQGVATQAMDELVRLARELRPVALDDLGLGAALRTQVDEFGRRAGLVTSLSIPAAGLEDLDADEQIVVYRIVQEGLSNVARHSGARNVRVDVERLVGRDRRATGRRRERLHAERRRARARDQGDARARRPRGRALLRRLRARARHDHRAATGGGGMRLVIADDHGVVRGGLRLLLDRQVDMQVVGEAADGAEAVAADARSPARTSPSSTWPCRA